MAGKMAGDFTGVAVGKFSFLSFPQPTRSRLQVHNIKEGTGPFSVRFRNIGICELQPGEEVRAKDKGRGAADSPIDKKCR
jgi:hypothetical protein